MKVGEHHIRPTDQVCDKVEYSDDEEGETLNSKFKINSRIWIFNAMADIIFHHFDRMCNSWQTPGSIAELWLETEA